MTFDFSFSRPFTLGIELELQLLDTSTYDLTPRSLELLAELKGRVYPGEIKPEMTTSMIEISTGICNGPAQALEELSEIRGLLLEISDRIDLAIAGGGSHHFQRWDEQVLMTDQRGSQLKEIYGYLCPQLTVFGQHVHVGCNRADDALYLLHSLSFYIPHFIALAASSPYVRGIHTGYHSARLNAFGVFPFSGRAPFLLSWEDFKEYFRRMSYTGIIKSMKDFYWDIRPKPEYGTVEVRIMDTPLTLEKATNVAAYIQALSRWLLMERPIQLRESDYLLYDFNRFQAARHGFDGILVNADTGARKRVGDAILETLQRIEGHAMDLHVDGQCRLLMQDVMENRNDASWIHSNVRESGSLAEGMRLQAERWRGVRHPPIFQ